MGDLASWACWTVHLRTPQLDIGVIATRRKYIPPVGDQYQDIFIVQTVLVYDSNPTPNPTPNPNPNPNPNN